MTKETELLQGIYAQLSPSNKELLLTFARVAIAAERNGYNRGKLDAKREFEKKRDKR